MSVLWGIKSENTFRNLIASFVEFCFLSHYFLLFVIIINYCLFIVININIRNISFIFNIIIHYNYQYLLIWPILSDNLVCSLFLCHNTEVLNFFVITYKY